MAIKPLRGKVLIRVKEAMETTKGGIVIPDAAKEMPDEGIVVAVGANVILDNGTEVPMIVNVDDTVIYRKYAGSDLKDKEDNEFKILSESDILAIVE